jgi:4-amino-4-deoxy-L-arabinose transferase-like glycosyltransferase
MMPLDPRSARGSARPGRTPQLLIAFAGLYWAFQVAWFWRYCRYEINIDAVCYIGIARHIADGKFLISLHGYWSPLISWLIAGALSVVHDRTLAARLLMLPAFVLCLALLHQLTKQLWGSRLLSALAVLWFVAARGVAAFTVYFIGADLLLTAAVLAYFILLLRCLERPDHPRKWFAPGVAHGVAFLAKAIAMPLLTGATVLAVLFTQGKNPKKAVASLIVAAMFPALIWMSWGTALRQKYGVFTTGYQLRWNLYDPALRPASISGHGLAVLHDTRGTYDSYMVTDAMPPGSPFWHLHVWRPGLLSQIAQKEVQNIPEALKNLLVLLTPGGVLALVLCVAQLTRARKKCPARFRFAWIVLLTTAALVLAYCMLVFDGRYVLPVTPVLIALGVRFAVPPGKADDVQHSRIEALADAGRWQTAACFLLIAGLLGVQIYWASPFRTIRQDFQHSVYDAADTLQKSGTRSLVAIGAGPYPDHGVGWEAGVYTAYFADAQVVAELYETPPNVDTGAVVTDVQKMDPDAVVLWGASSDSNYIPLLNKLESAYPQAEIRGISDPRKGSVGTVLVLRRKT